MHVVADCSVIVTNWNKHGVVNKYGGLENIPTFYTNNCCKMDKYEVVSVVGEGSFGRVYKAKVLNSDSYVALKLIVKVSKSGWRLRNNADFLVTERQN